MSTPNPVTNSNDELVPLPTAASRFGYSDAHYFRLQIAPRSGLSCLRQGKRWFVWRSELERAITALPQPAQTR